MGKFNLDCTFFAEYYHAQLIVKNDLYHRNRKDLKINNMYKTRKNIILLLYETVLTNQLKRLTQVKHGTLLFPNFIFNIT